jgi:hypothetical protein
MRTIFPISFITSSFFPCPITLLTMVLLVAAKAHVNTPKKPKMLRMVLEIARSRRP